MLNEQRVWSHYQSLKQTYVKEGRSVYDNNIWLTLARVHKAPVRKIKDVIKARKSPTMIPVWCCEFKCYIDHYVPKTADREYWIK